MADSEAVYTPLRVRLGKLVAVTAFEIVSVAVETGLQVSSWRAVVVSEGAPVRKEDALVLPLPLLVTTVEEVERRVLVIVG